MIEHPTWLPVVGWEGFYEVSYQGEIRSVDRRITHPDGFDRLRRGQLRKTDLRADGYRSVLLSRPGKQKRFQVHRLVAAAFIGPCPEDKCVMHLDGVRDHNHFKNLAYGTWKENSAMRLDHGTDARGANNANAKLTPEQVEEIRQCQRGQIKPLCQELKISYDTAKAIRAGRRWAVA